MLVSSLKKAPFVGAILLTVFLLAFALPGNAQNASSRGIELKGRITDSEGLPVVGATIQNLTEKTYTTSDLDGRYVLSVKDPRNATIEVSFLGMNTVTEALAGRTNLDVQLSEDKVFLEGSVITGYQEIQLKKVTGAVSTISAQTMQERYSPSIVQNLEGRVAGQSRCGWC